MEGKLDMFDMNLLVHLIWMKRVGSFQWFDGQLAQKQPVEELVQVQSAFRHWNSTRFSSEIHGVKTWRRKFENIRQELDGEKNPRKSAFMYHLMARQHKSPIEVSFVDETRGKDAILKIPTHFNFGKFARFVAEMKKSCDPFEITENELCRAEHDGNFRVLFAVMAMSIEVD